VRLGEEKKKKEEEGRNHRAKINGEYNGLPYYIRTTIKKKKPQDDN